MTEALTEYEYGKKLKALRHFEIAISELTSEERIVLSYIAKQESTFNDLLNATGHDEGELRKNISELRSRGLVRLDNTSITSIYMLGKEDIDPIREMEKLAKCPLQFDVFNILKKKKGFLAAKEIQKGLDSTAISVRIACDAMVGKGLLEKTTKERKTGGAPISLYRVR